MNSSRRQELLKRQLELQAEELLVDLNLRLLCEPEPPHETDRLGQLAEAVTHTDRILWVESLTVTQICFPQPSKRSLLKRVKEVCAEIAARANAWVHRVTQHLE